MNAVNRFAERVENSQVIHGGMRLIENSKFSDIAVMRMDQVQKMGPCTFQEKLRCHHILVTDNGLPLVPCNRNGLSTLNGLKEMVDMEGIIIKIIYLYIY